MDFARFKTILTAFADNPAELNISKGQVLVQLRDDLISARVHQKSGTMWISEDGDGEIEQPAEQWLINRIARLPQLADRILTYIPDEASFVAPSGVLLDQLESTPTEELVQVDNALSAIQGVLDRRPAGTSSVLYLTSDAGEGKTTVINHLARIQAQSFKNKTSDWLLLPVPLGGRPFLRLDDVIIASLVNRLRFPLLYFEAFLELVKLGVLVPALDGFEEMFIESATGEAISNLGSLVETLQSQGSALIAARKAYFEYRSFQTQARLFDALGAGNVSFSKLELRRWDKTNFLAYCDARKVSDGLSIYQDVAAKLGSEHPLLTRAVLASRLLDIATEQGGRASLLSKIGGAPDDYFAQFVGAIIEREANTKWISKTTDKVGEARTPLLTVEEHHELLSMIALEMWENKVDALKTDTLDVIAEIFCDRAKKPPPVARQVQERVKQHALMIEAEAGKNFYRFDHEEFRNYFLGEAIGRALVGGNALELRRALRIGALPSATIDTCSHWILKVNTDWQASVRTIQEVASSDGPTSFTRENCGGIFVRIANNKVPSEQVSLRHFSFPPDSLEQRALQKIDFSECYFQPTTLANTHLSNCRFTKCEFERLDLSATLRIDSCSLVEATVRAVTPIDSDLAIFDPKRVEALISSVGFQFQQQASLTDPSSAVDFDEDVEVCLRAFRAFLRATEINEDSLKAKVGRKANDFTSRIVPILLKRGILTTVTYRGSGGQRRFKLSVQMSAVQQAEASYPDSFEKFLDALAPK
ncbi:pentapeptide repeat-containing protein [Hyalangium gracile]|uniref:pentapeptide repeat-containing protein n=1 Tax=Hyalangium gracile TaxID=394092 RepID=UPI001CCF1506|nr:pentapeptide repeat-containing protein [Hyalangium gracile]